MQADAIRINCFASPRTSSVVLYILGKNEAIANMQAPITKQQNTENTIILRSVSTASSNLPAPSCCPTMMDIALPNAINTTLKRLATVFDILNQATTARPLVE